MAGICFGARTNLPFGSRPVRGSLSHGRPHEHDVRPASECRRDSTMMVAFVSTAALLPLKCHHRRANEVLGPQTRLAHSHRVLDKIASQTLKPCYFDGAVRMKQIVQLTHSAGSRWIHLVIRSATLWQSKADCISHLRTRLLPGVHISQAVAPPVDAP
jgi:hypothetical protein